MNEVQFSAAASSVAPHKHVFLGEGHERNERRTWFVIVLCGIMMLIEIVGGIMFGSIALVADGLHMSTHAGALLLAALAYSFSRRYATDPRFTFGTGKLGDLAGFTSAIVLAMIAMLIGYESVTRLQSPVPIHFGEAIPIAVLGLCVNIASAWLLSAGSHDHDPSHSHGHSHNAVTRIMPMTANNPPSCVEPYLDSFEQTLAANNYTPWTLRHYRARVRCLGRLMDAEDIAPAAMTPELADRLALAMPAGPKNTVRPANLARRFVQHLIDLGVASPPPLTEAQIARAALFADYEAYLVKQRGLSPRTIYHTLRFAHRFLDHRFGVETIDLPAITPADVVAFVQQLMARKRPYRDKTVGTHLRTFFQYLFARGITGINLAPCVPKAARRWDARLPRYLSSREVETVLAWVRSNPRHGTRDYAMLLLMARLGLRAPEVIAIELDDIDWRAGELVVRGKGQRHDRVPIPPDVGEAIARYLREDRVSATSRALFVTLRAPNCPFNDGQVVNDILKQAFAATGVTPPTPYVGSHVLRHSLATGMVRAGASLDEVGDMLRHRSRASTMIYAKLDIEGLRSIAQPWPVAGGAL